MKTVFTLLALFLSLGAFAQAPAPVAAPLAEMPVDASTGKIFYSAVGEVPDAKQITLYTNAKTWFADAFKSAKDVIQTDEKEGGVIIGKGLTQLSYPDLLLGVITYNLYFTVKVMVKDGRYKYEFTDFKTKYIPNTPPGFTIVEEPAEELLIKGQVNKNGKPNKKNQYFKMQSHANITALVTSLNATMKKADW